MSARNKVEVVGHRGAMGYAPENTIASFKKALELGVDFIELDVHLARDGVPVVIHDNTLDRTTDGKGLVAARSIEELKALDAGSWFAPGFAGERLPTLDDVLHLAAGRCKVAVEIKNGPVYYRGIEDKVVEALRRFNMVSQALVISFDHPTVERVKVLEPRVATGVLFVCCPSDPVALAKAARAEVLLPHWAYVTRELVAAAHSAGLRVAPWVVDDLPAMKMLLEMGVDAMATNYPDRLRGLLE